MCGCVSFSSSSSFPLLFNFERRDIDGLWFMFIVLLLKNADKITNYTCSVIIIIIVVTHFECYAKVSTLSLNAAPMLFGFDFFFQLLHLLCCLLLRQQLLWMLLLSHSFHDCEDRKSISKDNPAQSERCIWECDYSWCIVKKKHIPFATEKLSLYKCVYFVSLFFPYCKRGYDRKREKS